MLAGSLQVLRRHSSCGDDDFGRSGRPTHEDRDRGDSTEGIRPAM